MKLIRYLIIPLIGIGLVVWYMVRKILDLRSKLAISEAESKLSVVLSKKEEATQEADNAEKKFMDSLNSYTSTRTF